MHASQCTSASNAPTHQCIQFSAYQALLSLTLTLTLTLILTLTLTLSTHQAWIKKCRVAVKNSKYCSMSQLDQACTSTY
jgi:invasion protein IalB